MEYSPGGTYIQRRFDIGSILSRTFSLFGAYPLVFLGIGFIGILPTTLLGNFLMPQPETVTPENMFSTLIAPSLFSTFVQWTMNSICQGAVAVAVYRALRGEEVGLGESIGISINRIFALMLVSLLAGICIFFASLFLLIPGIIVACMLAIVIPACIVEQLGPLQSISRSAELTQGNRFNIFILYLVLCIAAFVFLLMISIVANLIFLGSPLADVCINVLTMIPSTIVSIMVVIVYYDLRDIQEGVSVDSLADIFE